MTDLIRVKYEQSCRSLVYRERGVTTVNYIEGFVGDTFCFGLPTLGPDECFNAFYERATAKMRDTLIERMLETLKTVRSHDYQPEAGKLVFLDVHYLARREKARIAAITRKNSGYIDGLHRGLKVWKHPHEIGFKRAALWELSWYYCPDPAEADNAVQRTAYNRVMHQLQELDDAGI